MVQVGSCAGSRRARSAMIAARLCSAKRCKARPAGGGVRLEESELESDRRVARIQQIQVHIRLRLGSDPGFDVDPFG